jgi:pyrophosphatase PpaX
MKIINRKPDVGNYRALLTDLDGTLIHSQDAICEALFVAFAQVGARVPTKEEILSMFGLPVEVMLVELGGIKQKENEKIERFIEEYKKQYPLFMQDGATLIENAKATVREIANAGYPICLITSERWQNAQFILERLGLSHFIENVVSRDDVERFKPDPEPLLVATKLLSMTPDRCIYIGESPFDIQAGVRAGVYVAAIGSGNWSVESLIECDPDILLDDIEELTQLFGIATMC